MKLYAVAIAMYLLIYSYVCKSTNYYVSLNPARVLWCLNDIKVYCETRGQSSFLLNTVNRIASIHAYPIICRTEAFCLFTVVAAKTGKISLTIK